MTHPMEYMEEADANPRQWEKLDDIKDQSHADLLKRYVNLSQENLRLKCDLTKITRDRDDLRDFCKGVAININNMLKPIGDA